MIALVSDTSILVDLERGGLLDATFNAELTLVVPDLLYQRELEEANGPHLRTLGLYVAELTPDVSVAGADHPHEPARALTAGLCCALRPEHTLLTGDKTLRKEAEARSVREVHGLLWVLDRMADSGRCPNTLLHKGAVAHRRRSAMSAASCGNTSSPHHLGQGVRPA